MSRVISQGSLDDLAILAQYDEIADNLPLARWIAVTVLDRMEEADIIWHQAMEQVLVEHSVLADIYRDTSLEELEGQDYDPDMKTLLLRIQKAQEHLTKALADAPKEVTSALLRRPLSHEAMAAVLQGSRHLSAMQIRDSLGAYLRNTEALVQSPTIRSNPKLMEVLGDALCQGPLLQGADLDEWDVVRESLITLMDNGWLPSDSRREALLGAEASCGNMGRYTCPIMVVLGHPKYPLSSKDLVALYPPSIPRDSKPLVVESLLKNLKDILTQPGRTSADAHAILCHIQAAVKDERYVASAIIMLLESTWGSEQWGGCWHLVRPDSKDRSVGLPDNPDFKVDPNSGHGDMLRALAQAATPENYRALWSGIGKNQSMAEMVLVAGEPSKWAALSADALERFVRSDDSRVRQAAVLAAGLAGSMPDPRVEKSQRFLSIAKERLRRSFG